MEKRLKEIINELQTWRFQLSKEIQQGYKDLNRKEYKLKLRKAGYLDTIISNLDKFIYMLNFHSSQDTKKDDKTE